MMEANQQQTKVLHVSSSPHDRTTVTTRRIMLDVAIGLAPTALFGCFHFGFHAFFVLAVSVVSAILTEYFYEKRMHLPLTVSDGSALVTGLLLGLNMPPEIPVWMPALGSVFAILVVKMLFGGLGKNFMNPALAARCFLLISFGRYMTDFSVAGVDAVTGATPLAQMKAGESLSVSLLDLFLGNHGGTVGEVSALAILVGAAYLLIRKVISPRIPFLYLGSFVLFLLVFGGHGADGGYLLSQLLSGGILLGAFFMATDYVTSPITKWGQVLFALFLGVMTGVFRVFGSSAEGVSYAIIIGNLLVPLIERVTMPRAFGKGGKKHGKNSKRT